MNNSYAELLVKKKNSGLGLFLKILLIILAAVFILVGMGNIIILIIGIVLGVAAYFVHLNTDIEYEYIYLDKELTVDKIMAKTRRKKIAAYDIERMEMIAPVKSWHLDNFKNRTFVMKNFSSGRKETANSCFAMIYDGKQKLILEATPDFVKVIQTVAPRKVFLD